MMTATAENTKALTINAAFLQEIKDDNRHLRDLLKAIRGLIGNRLVLRGHLNRLITLLGKLRDQLAIHFTLKEAYGYLEDAIDVAPRLTIVAEQLREEHAELFVKLVRISDAADAAALDGFPQQQVQRLVDQIHDFDDQLSEHDANGIQLLYEAMNRDIGGEG